MVAAGIEYVGLNKDADSGTTRAMKDAGLKVWVWTVNIPTEAAKLAAEGAVGIFTDDPWTMSRKLD